MFDPRKLIPLSMEDCSAPIAVITEITEKTPIVMPIIVSAARSLFAPRDASAILTISLKSILVHRRERRGRRAQSQGYFFNQPEDASAQSVFQQLHVEIDYESNFPATELQVTKQLRVVDWEQRVDCFDFNQDRCVNYNVRPIAAVQFDAFVFHRNRDLPFKWNSADA